MPEMICSKLVALRETADRFAREILQTAQCDVELGKLDQDTARANIIAASKQAGLYSMPQPRSHGGLEAGPLALTVVREALAMHNPRWLSWVFGPGPGVLAEVPEPLRSTHLQPLLAGTKRAAFGFTEPADAPFYTRAQRSGDELIVDGSKSFVTRGAEADFINVLVEVPEEGRVFVVIDTDAAGVRLQRLFETLDGSTHAAFCFESVRVPSHYMIGRPGQGMPKALHQIGDTRLSMAAEAVGRACWVVEYLTGQLLRHKDASVSETNAGTNAKAARPIGEGERLRYGELRAKVYAARSTLYRAARHAQHALDEGGNSVNEVIMAKLFATETLGEVVDKAIQLIGGSALMVDHPLARLYREARVLRVAEGLSDVLRLNIARGALELGKGSL